MEEHKNPHMAKMYFEDFEVGQSYSIGPRTVTQTEIVEFASQYDPQSFHVDEDAAEDSIFGDLIASGWHTASVTMRLLVDGLFKDVVVVGAVGVDELRWRKPVYGGDELSITTTVTETDDWDDDKGLVTFDLKATNQDDETVMTRTDHVLIDRAS
ncbi:MaoC/PaaZ C-terminal domain-containing protein [Natronosalvus halobius]|uniref:MaoC/PaaZ C-terminal domain-containing protein n=1 Tax=Natronosalvus halobius TaxID=2953746 RepID=UPI00209F3562|nr:MaoC/PaaZ C-terminal domain-containing protein [Natronosalvus halobius]USZ73635.1 MaoC family dehydratase N-terminal domain-containing protein [Natronosalvus halobius]